MRQLQSLLGLLNFACRVIKPGRAFLRRLIFLTIDVKEPHHFVRITAEARKDIDIWLLFLTDFNGISILMEEKWLTSPHLNLYTDSAVTKGFGAVFGSLWTYGSWEESIQYHITLLEMYPILLALYLWGKKLQNAWVIFHSDNMAVVDILNKQSSKEPTIMILVRKFVLLCLQLNINFRLEHIPGAKNIIPDLLSRFQIQEARRLAPHLQDHPAHIPLKWRLSSLLQDH